MGLFGVNWKQALWGGLETALDIGASLIPGGSVGKKMAKKAFKGLSRGVGVTKDLLNTGSGDPFGDLSTNFDTKLKKGLDQAKSDLENESKKLQGAMDGMKSELEGQLKQQGEKFNEEIKDLNKAIANATGAVKKEAEDRKKALQAQKQELESKINEVTEQLTKAQNQLRKELDEFKNEVNERFEEQEQKILENKRKIEEEKRQREEEIREVKDNIKLTNTNVENLRKEKEQLEDEFVNYKSQINQQTTETQQAFEDSQAEYERRTKIIETQIEDNQETLEEFSEQLTNVQNEQARQKLEQEEIVEELQEQSDILHFQKHKLDFVANQMEEIHEEVHERMDKLSQKLDERTNETLNIAKDANQKIDKLTEEVKNIKETTEELQEQVKKNKEETEKAKKEAKLANERLDNLLKTQALSDYSQEQSNLDKITKSLELKAEETKLLATLNLLQETKKLVQVELSEIDWRVGTGKGTERETLREEGMPLNPNSSWAKKYTPEQLREWGWDTRLLGDNEKAPLTDLEKRKEKQAQTNEQNTKAAGEESTQAEEAIEKIEELKAETLERLSVIQTEIRTGLEEIENTQNASAKPTPTQTKIQTIQEAIQQKKQQLNQKEQKVQQLEKKPYSAKTQKQLEQAQKEQEKAEQELEQAQTQLSNPSLQFEQEIEKYEESQEQEKQEELTQQWQTIQTLSKQALQEQPEEEQEEIDVQKPLEELVQQLKEMEQVQAASKKTMTYAMLFLIIFLLEYVVYKRNGLPGLVVLNIILLICYWYKDQLMEYADLWGKYLLIIGYVMGNVLAYSAPEQEKYKWPCVIGFNLCIAGIYGYTLWQQKKAEAEREAFLRKQSKEICQTLNISEETWESMNQLTSQQVSELTGWSNPFSSNIPTSQKAEHFQELVNQQLQEQEAIAKKELEIQQQVETLQKATELEQQLKGNLEQIQGSLGSPKMTWTKIKETYPEFTDKSVLLEELEKANRLLAREEKETNQVFLTKLAKIPIPNQEECQLLSQLYLNIEQYIALSSQAQYLTREEKELLVDVYPTLNTQQKLQLLSSGLNNLGIDSYQKKEKFVQLNHSLYQEKQLFGLSTKEKEQVLRLLVNTLNLSPEQRESLESMGISFFNASNWQVSEEQKDHLLDFGLNKLELTEEQAKQLEIIHSDQFKTFSLTGQQKNILNSLAPLIREDKYSEESLALLKSLHLKPNTTTFLVNEEIIPDPNTSFGVAKSSYLPLKIKFLGGEQKTLRKTKEIKEKKISEEEIKENKLSILRSLMNWAEKTMEEEDLKEFNYSLDNWVKEEVIKEWQKDLLLTCGFKTVPKYNFFELLIFCVEKFAGQNWNEFLANNEELAREFEEYTNSLQNPEITINETIWEKFVSSQDKGQREITKQLNLKELIEEQINKRLGNWKPIEEENWLDIDLYFDSDLIREWKSKEFAYETTKEWIDIGLTVQDSSFAEWLRDKMLLTPEEILNQGNEDYLREQFAEQQNNKFEPEKPSKTSSRYDNLFANLSKEEAERKRKKLEREETNRKLQEQERARREERLSEKDRKLKEDEERRAEERELAEQEEKKRREAEEARNKSLQAEQETLFQKKIANAEEAKKRAEQALANQIKQNGIAEKKKRDEIEKMEKENQAEQERLAKQAELIEEEKQKKLAQIALEDKEERQRIEKKMNEEKATIEREMAEKKRKNDEELKKKENALLKQRKEKQAELEKIEKEVQLQETLGRELKEAGRQRELALKGQKNEQQALRRLREQMYNGCLDFYMNTEEIQKGTRYRGSSCPRSGCHHLRDLIRDFPGMSFNLYFGDIYSGNWGGWTIAMKTFYNAVGNQFVTNDELKRIIEQEVQISTYLDSKR